VLRDPDLILISAPPESAADWRAAWEKFPTLHAVRNGNVLPYADERMDRMGPSVIDATSSLCELIERARTVHGPR
jgi:ABC-type Fe3+-hydroxamate transport system substrate-binding protein